MTQESLLWQQQRLDQEIQRAEGLLAELEEQKNLFPDPYADKLYISDPQTSDAVHL